MSVSVNQESNGTIIIQHSGNLQFDSHDDFRKAYEGHDKARLYIIDLRRTEYIDSSGLGMLLEMRKYIGTDASEFHIINCTPAVLELLKLTNFQKFFKVEGINLAKKAS